MAASCRYRRPIDPEYLIGPARPGGRCAARYAPRASQLRRDRRELLDAQRLAPALAVDAARGERAIDALRAERLHERVAQRLAARLEGRADDLPEGLGLLGARDRARH